MQLHKFTHYLPQRLRTPTEQVRTLWAMGLFNNPLALARQWRHRVAFARVQKSLLQHRYATALLLAHEVNLYNVLLDGPLTVDEVAEKSGIHPRPAESLLRILESGGLVTRKRQRYALSAFAGLYLARDSEFSLAPMLDLMAAQAAAFSQLPRAMATGNVPGSLNILSRRGRYKAFLGAVNSYLDWATRDLLSQIELPPVKSFIVGSMGVSFSAVMLERFPDARVTYGCLDHLVARIPQLRKQYGVPDHRVSGTHCHGGDPAEDRWGDESYDLVFLTKKMILEPDQQMGRKFAAKSFEVLRPGGTAIFWETVHPDRGMMPLPRAMEAVLDLGASPIGPVTTEGSMQRMLSTIGFRDIEVVPCLGGQTTFVVARKA